MTVLFGRIAALVSVSTFVLSGCSDPTDEVGAPSGKPPVQAFGHSFVQGPCPLPAETPQLERFICGTVRVLTRPEDASAGTVDIALAILQAANEDTKQPDPILYIQGGPAAPSIAMAPPWASSAMAENRDIIFFDRRGSHFSGQKRCPNTAFALVGDLASDYDYDVFVEAYVGKAAACRAEMATNGYAPEDYTLARISDDLEAVRQALDLRSWNIIGHSAGGPQALHLMQRYPSTIRSVILESATNLRAEAYGAFWFKSFARTLREVFHECAASPTCAAVYPDPEVMLLRAVASFDEGPLELSLPAPDGTGTGRAYLNSHDLMVLLFSQHYDAHQIPNILRMIKAADTRDTRVFAPVASIFTALDAMSFEGVRLSIECDHQRTVGAATAPEPADALERALARGTPPGLLYDKVCPVFAPDMQTSSVNPDLPTAQIPVLVLTGGYDGILPPAVGKKIADGLPRASYINFRHASHQVFLPHPCAHDIGKAFFDAPLQTPSDVPCQGRMLSPFANAG